MLTPFQQTFGFHQAFYRDYVSVHGFLAVIHGFVNWLFYHGSYAAVAQTFTLVDSIFAGVMGAALCLVLEPGIALLLVLFILPSWDRFYCFPIILSILTAPKLLNRSSAWILVAGILGILSLIFDHAPGLAIILALAPWVVLAIPRGPEQKRKNLGRSRIIRNAGTVYAFPMGYIRIYPRQREWQLSGLWIFHLEPSPSSLPKTCPTKSRTLFLFIWIDF